MLRRFFLDRFAVLVLKRFAEVTAVDPFAAGRARHEMIFIAPGLPTFGSEFRSHIAAPLLLLRHSPWSDLAVHPAIIAALPHAARPELFADHQGISRPISTIDQTHPSQILPQSPEEGMPDLPLRRFRAVFDFRKQLGLNPDALVRDALGVRLRLANERLQSFLQFCGR